jgi:hypothetical protein
LIQALMHEALQIIMWRFGKNNKVNKVRVMKEAGMDYTGRELYLSTTSMKVGIKYGFGIFTPIKTSRNKRNQVYCTNSISSF